MYDQGTREGAVRLYQERGWDQIGESAVESRRGVGGLLDIRPEVLRCWVERAEIDAGGCAGVTSVEHSEIVRLKSQIAELRRANEILEASSAFFAAVELDRKGS